MMMTVTHMLGLTPGTGTASGSTTAPAAAASAPVNAAAAAATSAPASDAPHVFSALMHGLSVRSKPGGAKVAAEDVPAGDGAAPVPGDSTEATASGASDAAVVAPETKSQTGHDSDLPGMAMPLLPAAIDLSLNAAAQAAAAAASGATAALRGEPRRSDASGPSAGAADGATAGVGAADAQSAWPAVGSGRTDTAAGRFAATDDDAGASGHCAPAAPDIGDRGNATRGSSAATALTASTGPLPDASALPVQNHELAAVTVKLPTDAPSQWRQALTDALGDRLQVQVSRNIDQAVIRLDPPMLGRIDISISQSSGNLQVHLSASNADVLRQLHDVGANLRQDLAHRQYGDVAVTVAEAQTRGGDSRQRGRQATPDDDARGPGKALAEAEAGSAQVAYRSLRGRD